VRLAYVVSRYPFVSHVFILREVLALRQAGVHVETFTIRRPGPGNVLSAADREAAATTRVIVPPRPLELVAAHAEAFVRAPMRYLSTLALAVRLRGRGARSLLWQVFYFGEAALMWRACRRAGIRHMHAHHANVASDVALLASRLGGAGWSWSFTMHGSTEFFDVHQHRLRQKVELARFVVCVSHHGRSQLMGLVDPPHWDKLRVVRCGVDVTAFAPPAGGRAEAPFEVLTVGRVDPIKGQPLLLEALAELRRRGLDARLTFVGDGDGLAELQALAARLGVEDRAGFPGAVGQDEIRAYYRRASAFALPSFAEGLPVVLVEAMACGLPVVASRITGIPELVEEGVAGLLVTPGRAGELADALAALAADPERRAAMGRAGRAKIESEFDIERTTGELLDVFRELVPG
jgi:glycosyltransferase involved in cell wall biosynthesis